MLALWTATAPTPSWMSPEQTAQAIASLSPRRSFLGRRGEVAPT
jgi:hypothetical protein